MDHNQLLYRRQQLLDTQRNERRREKSIRAREAGMSGFGEAPGNSGPINNEIKAKLSKLLPPDMIPGNVGDIEYSQWGFYNSFDFDFGIAPTLNATFQQTQQIQVSQEAAFLLTHISVDFAGCDTAGELGPWRLVITDAQSRRQMTNPPLPLQHFGSNSRPTKLLLPMIFYPNSQMQILVDTWLRTGESVPTVGSSAMEIVFYGIRVFTKALSVNSQGVDL